MQYITHNHDDLIDINGTHLLDTIELPYSKIAERFGAPMTGDFDKVQAEWIIKFEDGLIGTIYDWKEYGRPYWDVDDWHIGGHNQEVAFRIKQILLGE
jgi:hypothetical protein